MLWLVYVYLQIGTNTFVIIISIVRCVVAFRLFHKLVEHRVCVLQSRRISYELRRGVVSKLPRAFSKLLLVCISQEQADQHRLVCCRRTAIGGSPLVVLVLQRPSKILEGRVLGLKFVQILLHRQAFLLEVEEVQ